MLTGWGGLTKTEGGCFRLKLRIPHDRRFLEKTALDLSFRFDHEARLFMQPRSPRRLLRKGFRTCPSTAGCMPAGCPFADAEGDKP